MKVSTLWPYRKMSRRDFLRYHGIASSALTLSPFFLARLSSLCAAAANLTRVYQVKNNPDPFLTLAKLWELLDGPAKYIGPADVVVIKGNAQWKNQGYTHTGCIKAVIDQILQLPNFSGEILLCDNTQGGGSGAGTFAFDVPVASRVNNWPDKNWSELAADYQAAGKPVAAVRWQNDITWRTPPQSLPGFSSWNPSLGPGWSRFFFTAGGRPTYLSYPVFQSPLTPGRLIDMKNGVWENGSYSGRKVKAIFMPTLNNHGVGSEDYSGVTGAVKSFFGATEIFHGSPNYISDDYVWNGFYSIHSCSFSQTQEPNAALVAGQLVGSFINNLYAPVLYITAAMYAGWYSRTDTNVKVNGAFVNGAAATNTVLACENPVSLDYIACRDVISKVGAVPPAFLDPSTQNNNTWRQLLGCSNQGIGTVDPQQIEVITYDFNRPTTTRLDIERKIREFRAGKTNEAGVKEVIQRYMSGS